MKDPCHIFVTQRPLIFAFNSQTSDNFQQIIDFSKISTNLTKCWEIFGHFGPESPIFDALHLRDPLFLCTLSLKDTLFWRNLSPKAPCIWGAWWHSYVTFICEYPPRMDMWHIGLLSLTSIHPLWKIHCKPSTEGVCISSKDLQKNYLRQLFFCLDEIKTNYFLTKQVVWTYRKFFFLRFDTRFACKQQRLAKIGTILWLLLSTKISQVPLIFELKQNEN